MTRKIDIPKKGLISAKICIELASDCERLSFQVLALSKEVEKIITDKDVEKLISLRDEYFKKYFGIISGLLKNISKEIRSYVFDEEANDEQQWQRLGKDSERLGYFAHNILNVIEILVSEKDEELKKLLDENFRKILLITSGVLKNVSFAIRNNKISKSKGE